MQNSTSRMWGFMKVTLDSPLNLLQILNGNYLRVNIDRKLYKIPYKTLLYYGNPKLSKNRYQEFTIKKKSGGTRIIHAPARPLKEILKRLNYILSMAYEPHEAATGFVLGKSVVDNAKKHLHKRYVYNIDLKDFFFSFDRNRVKLAFMQEPFNLRNEREPLAFFLACLCTHPFLINGEEKIVLPQGSPTSPTLTNIMCRTMDRRLHGLAKRFNMTYSRYADDITFSADVNHFKNEDFQKELRRIIEQQGFEINWEKERLQFKEYRQEVTGLTVNEKVNVKRRYIKELRMWIYYCEKYGYEHAHKLFARDYSKDKGHVKPPARLEDVMHGKLDYLKMVKGPLDGTYIKLKQRWEKVRPGNNEMDRLLRTWEIEGLDHAMEKFVYLFDANDE